MHPAEPLVLEPSFYEAKIRIAKLKRYNQTPGCHDQEVKHYVQRSTLLNIIQRNYHTLFSQHLSTYISERLQIISADSYIADQVLNQIFCNHQILEKKKV